MKTHEKAFVLLFVSFKPFPGQESDPFSCNLDSSDKSFLVCTSVLFKASTESVPLVDQWAMKAELSRDQGTERTMWNAR
jgi:hypothetical protein